MSQLINSRLSSDFAVSYSIPPKPMFSITVHIEGVNAVLMKNLISEGEHLATWECAARLGCNHHETFGKSRFTTI
jgi:hypothetical protein